MGITRRALAITFSSMGTTAVALGGGFLGFISRAVVRLYHDGWAKGWPVVRASLVGDAGIGLLVAFTVWLVVFLVSLGRAIEERKAKDSEHGAPDVVALTRRLAELEEQYGQRHLSEEQARAISRVVRKGLHDLRQSLIDAAWSEEDATATIYIRLLSIENDRETIVYRNEFANVFRDAGLGVVTGQVMHVPVTPENDQFVNCVTVVRSTPENKVRAFIMEALSGADLNVNESDDSPHSGMSMMQSFSASQDLAAVLIVGQRGR